MQVCKPAAYRESVSTSRVQIPVYALCYSYTWQT
nr:MAG TPA: hypothetical protein [Caudoviricetes sp.]